jgi:formylglycine-generating enzyme required for sulfatase activity
MEAKKCLSYLLALSLSGCVVLSLHPLYTTKDILFDEKVTGTWYWENDTLQFKGIGNPAYAYEISLTNKDGKKGRFVGYLVKLKGRLFLDICPESVPTDEMGEEEMEFFYNSFFFISAHTFLPVDSLEPEFKMRWADVDKVEEFLKKDPDAIKHEIIANKIVLTASTEALQQFLLQHADDRELFGGEIILRRQKAVQPSEPAAGLAPRRSIDLGGGVTMEFVLIPAGSFYMGSPSEEKHRNSDEGPVRRAQITKPFYMGKYEVTQAQYKAVMGSNPSHFSDGDLPVESVSWQEAMSFCNKLTTRYGSCFRLPTEAQWEYACRAGSQSRFYYGDDPDYAQLAQYAWYDDNSEEMSHRVGQKRPNKFGVYDMHGNVWEFCSDWWAVDYEKAASVDPTGPTSGTSRVVRGGSWYGAFMYCRSAARERISPDYQTDFVGFRVVMDLE